MNRYTIIAIALAAATGAAFADDITVEATPFASSASRAQVQAEFEQFKQAGVKPWSNQYNPLVQFSSKRTRAEVTADYIDARDEVAAFNGQDSGSAYLASRKAEGSVATSVAGEPRNPQ